LPDGTWVSGSVSVQTDQWLPREAGYTRAFQDSIAFYKPLNGNTETDITIVCRIDLNDSGDEGQGGFIPMWVYVKMIGMTGAASIVNMRQALVEEKEARLARGEVQVPWWKKGGLRLDKLLREQLPQRTDIIPWRNPCRRNMTTTDGHDCSKQESKKRFPWSR
jgi:hypothetical protein